MRINGLTYACFGVALSTVAAMGACSATSGTGTFTGSTATGAGGGDTSLSSGTNGQGGINIGIGGGAGTGVINPPCNGNDPNVDGDGDGFTGAQGDCNDCSAVINPGAQDFPGNNVDEDCDGTADNVQAACDASLNVASNAALDGAKALGLCKMSKNKSWGVVSAQYVAADGEPLDNFDPQGLGHGLLKGFGPNVHPQEGKAMLALSSGTARQPNDPGYSTVSGYDKMYTTGAPAGYPKESPACPNVQTGEPHDSAGLLVKIKSPTNAKSLKFNLNFYTYEWPNYICSTYNDFFVAMMTPVPMGQADGNISFDTKGNLISVNAGFLEVCGCASFGGPPCMTSGPPSSCTLGSKQLQGTGFDQDFIGDPTENSAATGWLVTTSPIQKPGSDISLLFAIWDSGDGVLDSTILLDNFTFDVNGADTTTAPVEVPK
ncbi:MAG: putative metal-binding motif-containing protein [Byssovorax sp.]